MSNYERAKKVVDEIKQGLWKGDYNPRGNDTMTISREDGVEIWVNNLSFNCCGYKPLTFNAFGYFWRHWVWFAAQGIRKEATRKARRVEKDRALEKCGFNK